MSSYLMVPGDKEKFLNKLDNLLADFFIINLEDGVFEKEKALKLVYDFFRSKDNKKIIFRVNPIEESGLEEIKLLNKLNPYAIRVSKIKNSYDVKRALSILDKDIQLHLSLETKEAFSDIKSLKLSNQVTTLYLGILDLLTSMELPQSLLQIDNPTIEYILSKVLVNSKIANFDIVSFVYQDYTNLEQFKQWCRLDKKIGFRSKVAISPKQLDIVNTIFNIDNTELEKAKYIVKIFEEKQKDNISGFSDIRYGFIDEPIYKDAKLLLLQQN